MSGRKDDGGKLRYDLIPVGPLKRVAEVYTIGSNKYSDRNWEKGLEWGRVYAALQRHANSWWGGERTDSVDGQHHLASVVWCALALLEYENTHPEMDDRIKKTTLEECDEILWDNYNNTCDHIYKSDCYDINRGVCIICELAGISESSREL